MSSKTFSSYHLSCMNVKVKIAVITVIIEFPTCAGNFDDRKCKKVNYCRIFMG